MTDVPADALVIGLGGNLGGEAAIRDRFRLAREALAELGDLRSAPLYRTAAIAGSPPVGGASHADTPQPAFLNSAVRIRLADATPGEIIMTVLELERLLGRDRRAEIRWGPRTIDLDVLVWGTRLIRSPELDVPHPRLAERRFVLRPLIELLGADVLVPGSRATLVTLERATAGQQVEEIAVTW